MLEEKVDIEKYKNKKTMVNSLCTYLYGYTCTLMFIGDYRDIEEK